MDCPLNTSGEDLEKDQEEPRNQIPQVTKKYSAPFLSGLSQCYLNPPAHQGHYRPHILLVSQVVNPDSFHYFLRLPRELRDLIYFHALRPPTNDELIVKPTTDTMFCRRVWDDEMSIDLPGYGSADSWSGREEMTNLLRVNRQIYHEASRVLYSDFRFGLDFRYYYYTPARFTDNVLNHLEQGAGRRIRRLGVKMAISLLPNDKVYFRTKIGDPLRIFPALESVEYHFLFSEISDKNFYHAPYQLAIEDLVVLMKPYRHLQLSFSWSTNSPARSDFIRQECERIRIDDL
ncbi:hypothetical protein AJ79_04520 [Helicocarpus griseus UAMH5409]|uniref:2EXR domain-containing protein n=1 Tax=Helicocarpus griseus UAMH5409 TaxID=1447875 RepID=A0A2B7XTB3_9EURO|nr:hypothetical protein AJ79_04520 [Helicocarpus griseus UAMH5409]